MSHCSITQLRLLNFRCFDEISVDFHPRLTILVAPNGGGKTAILDGVAVALRLFVDTAEGRSGSKGFSPRDIRLVQNPAQKMEPVTPVRLEGAGSFFGQEIRWSRERQSIADFRTTTAEAGDLKRIATTLTKQNQTWAQTGGVDIPLFPLISYYGTGRLWSTSKLSSEKKQHANAPNARHRGYTDCLSSSSHYKFFGEWFRRFSYEAQKNGRHGSPHDPLTTLASVQHAVDIALKPSGWRALEWDFAEDTIVAFHPAHGRLPVDVLSDGIRNMIGLVADIAHRATRLNPHLGAAAATQTPGIVLIDEVDMHLHPQWQQVVLNSLQDAFPLLQFLATTHSPQVLTTVPKQNIRVLQTGAIGWTAQEPDTSPLARESGDALAHIMGTHPRPDIHSVLPDIHAYEQLARAGRIHSEEAAAIRQRLDQAGFEFNLAERSLFEFLARRASARD